MRYSGAKHLPNSPHFLPEPLRLAFFCLQFARWGVTITRIDDSVLETTMDVLGDILSTLRLHSTVYFRAELWASIPIPPER